jgi:hypothetical protein
MGDDDEDLEGAYSINAGYRIELHIKDEFDPSYRAVRLVGREGDPFFIGVFNSVEDAMRFCEVHHWLMWLADNGGLDHGMPISHSLPSPINTPKK